MPELSSACGTRALDEFEEDSKIIGVFASESKAIQAKEFLVSKPGFADRPDGSHVDRYTLDQLHWVEGFVPVVHDGE